MGGLCLQVHWICLGHTLAPQKPPLFGHVVTMTFDLRVLPIFSCVVTFTFEPQIFRNPSQCPIKCFQLTKIATWYIWRELWLQNCIFVQIWSCGGLYLWPLDLKFQKFLTLPQQVFLIEKFAAWCMQNNVIAPKLHFCPYIWSSSGLGIWPLDLSFSNILKTAPVSLFNW